jgi:hypothetical protein
VARALALGGSRTTFRDAKKLTIGAPHYLAVIHTASLLIAATIVNSLRAAIQTLVRERLRPTAAAIGRLSLNLIGLGLGPLAIGSSSDHLAISLGMAQGLR